jgi:signal transduction histidine kinase
MVVLGNLEGAKRNINSAAFSLPRQRRVIQRAMQGAERAAVLTQRLLAFSRRQSLNPRALDLNAFVGSEVEFLQRTLGETIGIHAKGGVGLWLVEADINQLATNKPYGDNARKGGVRKRSQRKGKLKGKPA